MVNSDIHASPVNPLPFFVVTLLGLIFGFELYFQACEAGYIEHGQAIGRRFEFIRAYGVYDPIFDWMRTVNSYPPEHLFRLLAFLFIHQNFIDALFGCVFIAALGKFIADKLGAAMVLLVFLFSGILGGLFYTLILNESFVLSGSSTGVYGLIGAFTYVQFFILRGKNKSVLPAFYLIGFFMGIQLLWKILFGGSNQWLAELVGFAVGFIFAAFPIYVIIAYLRCP